MMVKVFISHQRADSAIAAQISLHLRTYHQILSYCDVIDTSISRGEDLADHIRSHMGTCTQLLAVVSPATTNSQWVPWEIGVATEKDFPLATYSGQSALPPEFLRKWPYIRTFSELDAYARISKETERDFDNKRYRLDEGTARNQTTKSFYSQMRTALRQ
ncbi:toll/interleukin-1 receptor domain-containing protein [Caulobacter sp. DWR2-3-1b2]|uniref:toll/interleukin-1 receptor domain-containing protein n=1 Tax=Caulobacter sp. DWR2-3-1b2 TaxID=2804642 RepID=UPI003CF163BF